MRILTILTLMTTLISGWSQEVPKAETPETLSATYKDLLDRSADIPVGNAFVPSEKKPQGEIRLLKRGRAWVVQSLIYTKYPTRFLKEVGKKEAKAWPKSDLVGKADSDLYLKDLAKAMEVVKAAYAKDTPADKLKKMVVELVFSSKHGFAVYSTVQLKVVDGRQTIVSSTPIAFTPLSTDYLRREMALIAQDSFGYTAETCAEIFKMFPEPSKPAVAP